MQHAGRQILDRKQERALQHAPANCTVPNCERAAAAGMATSSCKASLTLWPLPAPSPSSLTLGASCSRHQRHPQRPLSLWPPSPGRPSVALLLIQGQKYLEGIHELDLRCGINDDVETKMPAGTCSSSNPVWRRATGLQIQVTPLVDTPDEQQSDCRAAPPQTSTCQRKIEQERA